MRFPICPSLFPFSAAVLGIVLQAPPAPGQPVGSEFRVNTFTFYEQNGPRIAADFSGNFVVIWQSNIQDHSGFGIFGQRYSGTGEPLGAEFQVNTFTTYDQGFPTVASDSAGNFVVVWHSGYNVNQDGSSRGVFCQRYNSAGASLGDEFQVNTYTTQDQFLPSVASDSAGNFVVVWVSYGQDGSFRGVFGQRYGSSGVAFGAEFRVNTYTTLHQNDPKVASASGGNFVVVWGSYEQDGSSVGIFGQRYSSAGPPLGAEFRVNTITTLVQARPSIASDSGGNFVVVWEGYPKDGGNGGVFGQRYASSGDLFGVEFRVNTDTTSDRNFPSVASDLAGNFVVVWQSGLPIGATQDGSFYGTFGQRYSSIGVPLGTEFRVNTYTTDFQTQPVVAMDAGGHFVVVWDSRTQDGSLVGVFGQRFCTLLPGVVPPAATTVTQTTCQ